MTGECARIVSFRNQLTDEEGGISHSLLHVRDSVGSQKDEKEEGGFGGERGDGKNSLLSTHMCTHAHTHFYVPLSAGEVSATLPHPPPLRNTPPLPAAALFPQTPPPLRPCCPQTRSRCLECPLGAARWRPPGFRRDEPCRDSSGALCSGFACVRMRVSCGCFAGVWVCLSACMCVHVCVEVQHERLNMCLRAPGLRRGEPCRDAGDALCRV